MSEVRQLHKKAMELVNRARILDDDFEAKIVLKEALSFETKAAMLLYDKLQAEPTRSVLFRSAATLAYNCEEYDEAERMVYCGLSSPNVPIEIRQELIQVRDELSIVKELDIQGVRQFNYLQTLRKNAINIRLKPATPKYSEAVFIEDIVDVLKAVRNSFNSFIKVSFINRFGTERFGEKTEKIISKLRSEFPLLYVNSKFASFGASLSTDATIVPSKDYDKEVLSWRMQIFEEFKNDVIYLDYSQDQYLDFLKEKYSDEDRIQIYKGFLDIFNESKNYNIYFTDSDYKNVIKEGKSIPKVKKDKLIVKSQVIEEEEKSLVRTFGMKSKGQKQIRQSDIIVSEELNSAEFTYRTSQLVYSKDFLELKKELSLIIKYESGRFSISYSPFRVNVEAKTHEEVLNAFAKEVMESYHNLSKLQKSEYTSDLEELKRKFDEFIFSSTR